MARKTKDWHRMPIQQLTILAICRFAEPVAMTSVYPYIPEMIQSFNIPTDKVARWAGLLSACFSLSQALLGIGWGRASDRFGRKPMILLALTSTMISSVCFGFSSNLAMAFITRSLQGLSSGNVGIIRTTVAELVPERELQPLAFSVMPMVWSIGSIFGPALGGSLVYPAQRYPKLFGNIQFLKDYPFALPNLLISLLFLIGITSGILFLRESLEDKRERKDYGLLFGALVTGSCRKRQKPTWTSQVDESQHEEAEPFLHDTDEETHGMTDSPASPKDAALKPTTRTASWSQVFTRQSNLNLAVYTFLAMHSVAYDQLLPIFMHHPLQELTHNPDIKLPFRFASGFSLSSPRIGFLFTIYGTFGMLVQFFVFPPLARRYGVLKCYKCCAVTFPFVYVLTPFTALLPTNTARQSIMMCLMLIKCFCAIFSFPCTTILLTNSASSLKVLGTLNGVATSISAVGRAAGPALAGATFSFGVDHGYIVLPWWTLATIATIGAIPAWWLIEMEGFGAKQPGDVNDDDSDNTLHNNYDEDNDTVDVRQGLLISTNRDNRTASRRPSGTTASELGKAVAEDRDDVLPVEDTNLSRTMSRTSQQHTHTRHRRSESFSMNKMTPH